MFHLLKIVSVCRTLPFKKPQVNLTASGNIYWTPIPISRPHAAPVAKHGINKPALTLRPYVQIVRK